MKSILLLFALLLGWNSAYAHSKEPNPLITPEPFLEMASIIKTEITYEEWILFYDMMNLANGAEARNFVKNTDVKKYTASNPKDKVQLSK